MVRPRWLVGYSDVTALHQAFASHPASRRSTVGRGVAPRHTGHVASVRALLLDGETAPAGHARRRWLSAGALIGGNVAMSPDAGTPGSRPAASGIDPRGHRRAPYRLDRLLTQLVRAGWFDDARASPG